MSPIPVLLVDDSEPDRLFTGIVLQRCGRAFELRDFESAREALATLQAPGASELPTAWVLLDINMPDMDGFAFLRAYEALNPAQRRPIAVVMLSSSPQDSDRAQALSHRAVRDYVVKPLSVERARALADAALGPAGGASA